MIDHSKTEYEKLEESISEEERELLKQRMTFVLKYLREGISLKDSLILSEVSEEQYEQYKVENPRFAQLVARKQTEYKRDVIVALNEALTNKDSKTAQWIAEAKFPDEFSKKRTDVDPNKNTITNIINLIQTGEVGAPVLPKKNLTPQKVARILEPEPITAQQEQQQQQQEEEKQNTDEHEDEE